MDKDAYKRLNLKNGWDLPQDEKPPLTGRKKEMARAYELLVKKTDEEYFDEAEEAKAKRDIAETEKKIANLRKAIGMEKANPGSITGIRPGVSTEGSGQVARKNASLKESPSDDAEKQAWESELRDETEDRWKRRKRIRLIVTAAIAAAIILGVGGRLLLGPPILFANIKNYEDVGIEVEGLGEEPFTITSGELADMKLDTIRVPVHEKELLPDEEPELGKAIGPTLETFLGEYGYGIDDIRIMKVYNGKDQSTAYVRTMQDNKSILSVAHGHKALGEKEAPLRIAVEGTDAEEWSGWVRKIVFTVK